MVVDTLTVWSGKERAYNSTAKSPREEVHPWAPPSCVDGGNLFCVATSHTPVGGG